MTKINTTIGLTERQRDYLADRAAEAGLSLAAYVRDLILPAAEPPQQPLAISADLEMVVLIEQAIARGEQTVRIMRGLSVDYETVLRVRRRLDRIAA